MPPSHDRPTWLTSDRLLARSVGQPIQRFLHVEASGGVLLLAAAIIGLVWASSPWSGSYEELWASHITIELPGLTLDESLRHWVNDGLMALFFFVIGLEIKQELVSGQLASRRDAMVPIVAALGGMVVPATLYALLNAGGDGANGWGIPMATDVAFALGVLALLGNRVPTQLKVLLLGLAIVDDIGAILVIAIFYAGSLSFGWLALAAGGLVLVVGLRQVGVRYMPIYVVIGMGIWLATFESGVHATIAGVALGLLTPARPLLNEVDAERIAHSLRIDGDIGTDEVRDVTFRLREALPVTQRLQDVIHPWTSFVIVPVFALANAGVPLSNDAIADAVTSPVAGGVVLGLVVGKMVGISGAVALAVRLGWGRLPDRVRMPHIVGMAALGGIGFTVSIFVAGLAFDAPAPEQEAKLGVLTASVLAAIIGSVVLRRASRPTP